MLVPLQLDHLVVLIAETQSTRRIAEGIESAISAFLCDLRDSAIETIIIKNPIFLFGGGAST